MAKCPLNIDDMEIQNLPINKWLNFHFIEDVELFISVKKIGEFTVYAMYLSYKNTLRNSLRKCFVMLCNAQKLPKRRKHLLLTFPSSWFSINPFYNPWKKDKQTIQLLLKAKYIFREQKICFMKKVLTHWLLLVLDSNVW